MPRYIRDLPRTEQPIYRLNVGGAPALSDAELVAVITNLPDLGVAQRLLDHFGGVAGLARADTREIRRVGFGIGRSRAAQLKAALELARRLLLADDPERLQIRSPADANVLLRVMIGDQEQEHLVVLCLNTKNYVIKAHTVYIGNVNSAILRTAEIYREAIRLNAPAIIMAHNHPSQDPSPSPEDILITRQIVDAGRILDVECLDHIIVCRSRFVSLKERGLGFDR